MPYKVLNHDEMVAAAGPDGHDGGHQAMVVSALKELEHDGWLLVTVEARTESSTLWYFVSEPGRHEARVNNMR
jgi:hypothetical protein